MSRKKRHVAQTPTSKVLASKLAKPEIATDSTAVEPRLLLSRSERSGVIAGILVAIACLLAPYLLPTTISQSIIVVFLGVMVLASVYPIWLLTSSSRSRLISFSILALVTVGLWRLVTLPRAYEDAVKLN